MGPLFMIGVQFQVTFCHIFSITGLIGERITETLLLLWTRASSSTHSNWLLARGIPPLRQSFFMHYGYGLPKVENSSCNIGAIIVFLQKRSRVPEWHSSEY